MKRLASMLCAFILLLSLAACGSFGSYTPEMGETDYKAACSWVSYDDLARNPESYKGDFVRVSGEIFQVIENGSSCVLMVDVDGGELFETQHMYVTYTAKDGESRILEGDSVVIYGKSMGTKTYTTVLGASRTIPMVYGAYIDVM